jgi:tetratricopeptide (TPR) repeat protein
VGRVLAAAPIVPGGALQDIILNLQSRLRTVSDDWQAQADLGLAYVQQARITADPSYYPKAEEVLVRSLDLHPEGNFEAMTGMAALAAARHDFSTALSWGRRAAALNQGNADVQAVIGDALVELGRYEEAFEAFQVAVDLRPDLTTYSRASYAWELRGNLEAATEVMQLAHSAAGTPADAAWTSHHLAELAWTEGDLDRAEALYRRARAMDDSFQPARAGLAKVAAARGRTEEAVRLFEEVVARYPVPEYVIGLGDLLASVGRDDEARHLYALVDVEATLLRANGVNVDLEIALFDADHGRPVEALAAAEADWRRRHSVHVADAMAWALHANGRDEEALEYANRSLRLGTRDPLFLFHRGVIEHALGHEEAARRDLAAALNLNPHFSLRWSEEATSLLDSLGGGP